MGSRDAATQAKTVPVKYRALYIRACAGQASPRQTIKAKCQECCGWEDVISRVGGCTVESCPLWALRPYQDRAEESQAPESEGTGTRGGEAGV